MLATAHSAALSGLEAHPVRVEVEASRGLPSFELVGLAETAVRESRVRVRSALAQLGVVTTESRIVVNLAPADLRKVGSGFDLAIAVATLFALSAVPASAAEGSAEVLYLGELSLTGRVLPIRGVLPHLLAARSRGVRRAMVPKGNAAEAALVTGIEVHAVEELVHVVRHLREGAPLERARPGVASAAPSMSDDLADVRGQGGAKRALEIAAAGGHNLLFLGPPGSGKTMLARRLPSILPPLDPEEALEVMAIHSVAGLLRTPRALALHRPFRAPHHTVSEVALVGGGDVPRPGEVSLAHRGVLFLDELPEFRRGALEALRQPLEDAEVTISRALARATYPAEMLVVAAMNPCPCGFAGSSVPCVCTPERVRAYRGRLSGPLLDRIDAHVVLPQVDVHALYAGATEETSAKVRERVLRARGVQADRVRTGRVRARSNARLGTRDAEAVAHPCDRAKALLVSAVTQLGLSARAHGRILRVARTIADLAGEDSMAPVHVAEAIALRVLDRGNRSAHAPVHAV
ncbi:MAG: YifB family Mg chelatase-like AAA ATPase [Polyangiaceae bacterium]